MSAPPPFAARAAIFDLDGTLLDTEPLYYAAYASTAADLGKAYSFEHVHRFLLGRPEHVGAGEFLRILGIDGLTPEELLAKRDVHFLAKLAGVAPLPGALAAAASFAKLLPLAIATSSSRSYLPHKRAANEELFALFNHITCGDDDAMKGKPGKPDPAIFLAAADALGVPPSACVAFEDSVAGVVAAKRAGMYVVGIPDGRLSAEEFAAAGPDVTLASLVDFLPSLVGL